MRTKGWKFEPARHSLAAKGIKTRGKMALKSDPVIPIGISDMVKDEVKKYISSHDDIDENEIWENVVASLQEEGIEYKDVDLDELIEHWISKVASHEQKTYTPGGPILTSDIDQLINSPKATAALKELLVNKVGYATAHEFETGAQDGDVLAILFETAVTDYGFDIKPYLAKKKKENVLSPSELKRVLASERKKSLQAVADDIAEAWFDMRRAKDKLADAEDDKERELAKEEIFDLTKYLKSLRQEKEGLQAALREAEESNIK
jgi:hypothetical protein